MNSKYSCHWRIGTSAIKRNTFANYVKIALKLLWILQSFILGICLSLIICRYGECYNFKDEIDNWKKMKQLLLYIMKTFIFYSTILIYNSLQNKNFHHQLCIEDISEAKYKHYEQFSSTTIHISTIKIYLKDNL